MKEKLLQIKPSIKKEIIRYTFMVIACAIYAYGFCFFIKPFNIVAGGMTGLALLMNYIVPQVTIGFWVIILNAPIILLSFKREGIKFTINCLITILVLSGFTNLFEWVVNDKLPMYTAIQEAIEDNALMSVIFGAVLEGVAIGLFCKYRVSSGGTELFGRFVHEWTKKKFSIPLMSGLCDLVIVVVGCVVFKKIANLLYALIIIFIVTKVSDLVLIGLGSSKLCYIITDNAEYIGHYLIHNSPRGVTLINGKGMYTDLDKGVLLTVVRKSQLTQLKEWVLELDPKAFMIVSQTNEVLGNGFKHLKEDD